MSIEDQEGRETESSKTTAAISLPHDDTATTHKTRLSLSGSVSAPSIGSQLRTHPPVLDQQTLQRPFWYTSSLGSYPSASTFTHPHPYLIPPKPQTRTTVPLEQRTQLERTSRECDSITSNQSTPGHALPVPSTNLITNDPPPKPSTTTITPTEDEKITTNQPMQPSISSNLPIQSIQPSQTNITNPLLAPPGHTIPLDIDQGGLIKHHSTVTPEDYLAKIHSIHCQYTSLSLNQPPAPAPPATHGSLNQPPPPPSSQGSQVVREVETAIGVELPQYSTIYPHRHPPPPHLYPCPPKPSPKPTKVQSNIDTPKINPTLSSTKAAPTIHSPIYEPKTGSTSSTSTKLTGVHGGSFPQDNRVLPESTMVESPAVLPNTIGLPRPTSQSSFSSALSSDSSVSVLDPAHQSPSASLTPTIKSASSSSTTTRLHVAIGDAQNGRVTAMEVEERVISPLPERRAPQSTKKTPLGSTKAIQTASRRSNRETSIDETMTQSPENSGDQYQQIAQLPFSAPLAIKIHQYNPNTSMAPRNLRRTPNDNERPIPVSGQPHAKDVNVSSSAPQRTPISSPPPTAKPAQTTRDALAIHPSSGNDAVLRLVSFLMGLQNMCSGTVEEYQSFIDNYFHHDARFQLCIPGIGDSEPLQNYDVRVWYFARFFSSFPHASSSRLSLELVTPTAPTSDGQGSADRTQSLRAQFTWSWELEDGQVSIWEVTSQSRWLVTNEGLKMTNLEMLVDQRKGDGEGWKDGLPEVAIRYLSVSGQMEAMIPIFEMTQAGLKPLDALNHLTKLPAEGVSISAAI